MHVNTRLLLPGLVILVLGLLIVAYDLPQVAYLQGAGAPWHDEHGMVQRIHAELYAGLGIMAAGAAIIACSWIKEPTQARR